MSVAKVPRPVPRPATTAHQPGGSWLFAERKLMVDWTETYPSNP